MCCKDPKLIVPIGTGTVSTTTGLSISIAAGSGRKIVGMSMTGFTGCSLIIQKNQGSYNAIDLGGSDVRIVPNVWTQCNIPLDDTTTTFDLSRSTLTGISGEIFFLVERPL